METPVESGSSRAQIVTLTMNPALDITTSVDSYGRLTNCAARHRVTTLAAAASTSLGSRTYSVLRCSQCFPPAGRR